MNPYNLPPTKNRHDSLDTPSGESFKRSRRSSTDQTQNPPLKDRAAAQVAPSVTVTMKTDIEATVADKSNVSVKRARTVMETLRQFASVSELLRIAGAAVMVGALSMFLMQGWLEGNDIQRYFKLLAETLLLTAGGFGLSAWLKEHKGARLFFGLGLASIAANFTILGALIYSVFQLDGLLGSYPQFAAWTSQSPGQVLGVTALALAILIPVARLAFSVLARPAAKWLTTTYLIGGAMLLIPVRSSLWSCALAVALVAFVIYRVSKQQPDEQTPNTTEARFSILMLMLPPIILCVRSLYFYQVEALAFACMAGAAFLILRHLSLRSSSLTVQRVLDTASLPLTFAAAGAVVIGSPGVHHSMELPLYVLVLMPFIGELTLRRPGTQRSALFGVLGALAICAALMFNQALYSSLAVTLSGLAATSVVMLAGYWLKRASITCFGVIATLFLSGVSALQFFEWFSVNNWILLSILGAGAIVCASLLDRYGASLKLKMDALRANYVRA